jgi:soluble lytic murein transglycosylase
LLQSLVWVRWVCEVSLSSWNKLQAVARCGLVLAVAVPLGTVAQVSQKTKPARKGPATSAHAKTGAKAPKSATSKTGSKSGSKTVGRKGAKGKLAVTSSRHHRLYSAKPTPQSIRLTTAFTASAQLRPMAQQLAATRSQAAYAGVLSYASTHPGEGAAAAYLAVGHAYMLDRRFPDAASMFLRASTAGSALADYATYLGAQAWLQAGRGSDAYPLLNHFADRFPDSIFAATAPILLANTYIQANDAASALKVLQPLTESPLAAHADFRYALARAYQLSGNTGQAAPIFRRLYLQLPLSNEAAQSRNQLQAMGVPLTASERKTHADQLFDAKRYADAGEEYHEIAHNGAGLSTADLNALQIYAAVCDLKLKHLSRRDVERLPETSDDSAALKLYMLAELSRNEDDRTGHDAIIADMIKRFPTSRWRQYVSAEARLEAGDLSLLDSCRDVSEQHLCAFRTLAGGVDDVPDPQLCGIGSVDG